MENKVISMCINAYRHENSQQVGNKTDKGEHRSLLPISSKVQSFATEQ